MLTSKSELLREARALGYRPEMLEKIMRLLDILEQIMSVPYLRDRLVLKGGTALNLFYLNPVPRLSVDIDLNYIGQINREKMREERPVVTEAISKILLQNQMEPERYPDYHAGGKMIWRYSSLLGQKGNLEIDLNYMYRQPLWLCSQKTPLLAFDKTFTVPVLDIHELAAGKLAALFSRQVSRDFFDTHSLLTKCELNNEQLRLSFVIYLSMTPIELYFLKPETIHYDMTDLKNRLVPVLSQSMLSRSSKALKGWADQLLEELRMGLTRLLPLTEQEINFIQQVRTNKIEPELITKDPALQEKILAHPAILWAANKKTA